MFLADCDTLKTIYEVLQPHIADTTFCQFMKLNNDFAIQ